MLINSIIYKKNEIFVKYYFYYWSLEHDEFGYQYIDILYFTTKTICVHSNN